MTDIEICNYALLLIGQSVSIKSFVENTAEANICNRVYNMAKQTLLTEYPWNFAVKQAALTEVTDETNEKYAYVYEYPSDCLRLMKIDPQTDGEINEYKIIHTLDGSTTVKRIVCDIADAYAEYIYNFSDEDLFPPVFAEVLAYKVATLIAMPMTVESRIVQSLQQAYFSMLEKAKYLNAKEQQQPVNKGNRYILSRGARGQ